MYKMLASLFNTETGVFQPVFRRQLSATFSVMLIILCHGIGLGWLSPMLVKLQSSDSTPLHFAVTIDEASWIGALVCSGGLTGNFLFAYVAHHFGRKASLYGVAIPHMLLWMLIYFAQSVEYLYLARICGGMTGGGIYVVVPLFIAEIADPTIRGRLTSLFGIALNVGILVGFIFSSYIRYHLIPCIVIALPLLYLVLALNYPDSPQYLLRAGRIAEARDSFKFYRNYRPITKADVEQFEAKFAELRLVIMHQQNNGDDVSLRDFFNKRSLKALGIALALMLLNTYCGLFALTNYVTTIFSVTESQLPPDINTIIIGVVQIAGTYVAIVLVDRCGRKLLMIISSAGMGLGLAAFGMYAFFAEETEADLTHFSWWMPVTLMAFVVFIANVGIVPVTFVILVEIMPAKIRDRAQSFCMAVLSVFAFGLLWAYPIFQHAFGLSATMWFFASVCMLGLFFISLFLEETKGKSVDED